ncbi:A24 family peptidase [Sphingomicrobium flavum]|uniref:A24 family peptidase n=1 Tax=Sphingomicrobium flavum TaxID=1229164 RepID=UPI0021AE164F|nr:prepilin peptidase [Sphingomicrobium flavum]
MINATLTDFLTAILALILIWAAWRDTQTFKIDDRLVIAVAMLAPLFWWSVGLPLYPEILIRIGVALAVFLLLFGAFNLGMMGGGDVKLAAALVLWFSPMSTLRFFIIMSLAGAILTLAYWAHHKIRRKEGKVKVPYGVAIAIGGLWNLAQRFLNQFAG